MPHPQLFVIGDSISVQYGPYLAAMTRETFSYARKSGEEEALKNLDVPTGANSGDSSAVLDYLRAWSQAGGFRPELLLVNCGLHDIRKNDPHPHGENQIPREQYRQNLEELAGLLRRMERRWVWLRITPVEEDLHNRVKGFYRFARDVQAYNETADAVMRAAGVPRLDLFTFTAGIPGRLTTDGVHFAEPVRQQQAAFIAGFCAAQALP